MSSSPNGKSCQTESSHPTADELSSRMQLIDQVARWLEETGLSQAAIGQWKFNALAAAYPNDPMIQSVCQQASSLLGATQSLPEVGMTTTDVSLKLSESLERKIKSADVNNALVDLGYQIRHEDKRIWELTEEGREHGISLLCTSKTNKWSGPQVKWYSSILSVLEAYFSNSDEQSNGSLFLKGKTPESKTSVSSAPKEASDSTVVKEVSEDDSAATTAYKAVSKPKTEKESWLVSERLKFLKLKTTADMRMHIEMEAAEAYKEKQGKLPSKQLDKQKQCDVYHEVDLKVRPIYHRLEQRVKAHVFLCMLAYYVEWQMRKALAPLLFDDEKVTEESAEKSSVVVPSQRSKKARTKAATKKTPEKLPVHSFRTLMADLATIVKNKFQSNGLEASLKFEKITQPTVLQQKALDLLEVCLICTQ